MLRRILQSIFICSVILAAVAAHAAGFGVYEYSARGNALGNAVMAQKADPSSIAVNPAQLNNLEGTQFAIGVSGVYPAATVDVSKNNLPNNSTDIGSFKGKSSLWLLPHFYATHKLSDDWAVGVAGFSRFGLGTEFDDDWAGRYDVTYVRIQSFSVNPLIGYKVTDKLSVAAGPEIMWFEFTNRKATPNFLPTKTKFVDPDLEADCKGDSYGVGGSFGLHYQITDKIAVGASYRTEVKQTVKGDMTIGPLEGPAKGNIILPRQWAFGLSVKPVDALSVEVGATWVGWSSYSELAIVEDGDTPLPDMKARETRYHDAWRFNIGAEYNLTENWDIRGSYVYDQSPVNEDYLSYLVPSNDRHLLSAGLGWHNDSWSVDGSYTYLFTDNRHGEVELYGLTQETTFENANAHIFAITLGYKF
ncbi:MAG: OmpP1/FadL family transporter [Desulfovibrionales bacterium]|nr:OmpP1/FadL family transporter [Desulfovibrionales bacterium]